MMNGFMNSTYGWDYTRLVDNKEDEEKGGTDGEGLVLNAKCKRDDMIVLD